MRRVSLVVCLLCLLVCFPALCLSAPPGDLTGQEKAERLAGVMAPVFDIHLSQDFSTIEEGGAFSDLVLDEENEEARFEAREFFESTGLKLSCTVGREEAFLHLPETWDGADRDVVKAIHKGLAFYHREETIDGGVRVLFRHARLESKDAYYVVQLDIRNRDKATPSLTLGCYRKERSRSTAVFTVPDAAWKSWKPEVKEGETAAKTRVAVAMYRAKDAEGDVFGTHLLEVSFLKGMPWLSFRPRLYPMWEKANPESAQKGFIRELTGVFVDDTPFAAFVRAKERRPSFIGDPRQPFFPLGPEDFAALKQGSFIQFDLVSVFGEKMQVRFPLNGSMETLTLLDNLPENKGKPTLDGLVLAGDLSGVEAAMASGASVNTKPSGGMSPLALAVKMDDTAMVRLLGKAPDLDTEEKNSEGDGFLHIAAHYKHGNAMLDALLAIGCDTEIRDENGRTPLSRTVCYDGMGKVDSLLGAGARIDAPDEDGYTALHHTVRNRFSSEEETEYLIKHGADKNRRTGDGHTPLMVAIENQCWGHIQKLLALDVALSPTNNKGQTALAMAEGYRDSSDLTEMIPTLILAGEEAVKKTHEAYTNLATILENKGLYHIGFHNTTSETVMVAVRIKDTDGDWVTRSWAKYTPGEKGIMTRSPNSIFYFFAESESWVWKGTDNYRTISGKKVGMREVKLKSRYKGESYYYTLK
ncbi:ankyrin repeat domain-containing protein [Desulfoluna butyratoxydans]|uniref:Ankyrin repeats (3 copies) n=1 Tax=Desulfoluna butyratoxydans TaxID=231438 RepID=A0A4U8YMK0_9BACT|nr:ankyrin repeat domain-containing protein [Desulfoluna butyratoxydans]VFQ44764.1 ankyrin repeats (3 copies) [Desulfoluna butyratoxydans]